MPDITASAATPAQVLDIDWNRFDGLKEYLLNYISHFHNQVATQVNENKLVLLLLQAAYHLLRFGFYSAQEVASVIPIFLKVLDGRGDKVGLPNLSESTNSYEQRVDNECNTLIIMECKLWCYAVTRACSTASYGPLASEPSNLACSTMRRCCRVFSLVCTMRVDIRLSKLLLQYKAEYDKGLWAPPKEKKKKGFFGWGTSRSNQNKDGYVQLIDEGADAGGNGAMIRRSGSGIGGADLKKSRRRSGTTALANKGLFELLALEVRLHHTSCCCSGSTAIHAALRLLHGCCVALRFGAHCYLAVLNGRRTFRATACPTWS